MLVKQVVNVICTVNGNPRLTKRMNIYDTSTLQVYGSNEVDRRRIRCEGVTYFENSMGEWMEPPTPFIHMGYQYKNANGEWSFE